MEIDTNHVDSVNHKNEVVQSPPIGEKRRSTADNDHEYKPDVKKIKVELPENYEAQPKNHVGHGYTSPTTGSAKKEKSSSSKKSSHDDKHHKKLSSSSSHEGKKHKSEKSHKTDKDRNENHYSDECRSPKISSSKSPLSAAKKSVSEEERHESKKIKSEKMHKHEYNENKTYSPDKLPKLGMSKSDSTISKKHGDDSMRESSSKHKEGKKIKSEKSSSSKKRHQSDIKREVESDDESLAKKRSKSETDKDTKSKKVKKEDDDVYTCKWWENQDERDDSIKWTFLQHKGPVFADLYVPLPKTVKFYYEGKAMDLCPNTEEVATFYAKMLDHDYTTKEIFNTNFFHDWREVMTSEEKSVIKRLEKCNFREMHEYFKLKSEERKARSKEEKQIEKAKNEELVKTYGTADVDGYKQKIGNFKIEPPSLFRGRGEHPKMGRLKKRIWPEHVTINCSKNSQIPVAPFGRKWGAVKHDNTVTWLASWTENIQNQIKYVMLNASSRVKSEKDWKKYETARKLHQCVDKIRLNYIEDMSSKEMRIRQRAVAMYFIDKLALRAGNEKDEDTADTVGCCTLRVEHIRLHEELSGKENVVEFDFLGKDSMRYQNQVVVERKVFKNLKLFMKNKQNKDDLFDRLTTTILNEHLRELMDGLTAKVFRTYNASKTLQDQLKLLTKDEQSVSEKMLAYNRANRAVAILCNHQRSIPKTFSQQMENLQNKIAQKRTVVKEAKKAFKVAKSNLKAANTAANKTILDKKKKALERLSEGLIKLEVQATDKDENKDIALGTSKLNYLDPRISVAWCKKYEVPIEKIYNKTQREKFQWAIHMASSDFSF